MKLIDVSKVDFDTLKKQLVDFAKTYPEYSDWQFEGSNISFLVDMLTYTTYFTQVYRSFALNETFLDTATQRSNVVAKAKVHGYIPISRRTANIPFKFQLDYAGVIDSGLTLPDNITLPRLSKFGVKILNKDFTFVTLRPYTIFSQSGVFEIPEVIAYEGIPQTITTFYSITDKIRMPFTCDTATISVFVNDEEWTLAESGIYYNIDSKVYYIYENSVGRFEVYFGNGIVSAQPPINSKITINYLESSGVSANAGVAEFDFAYLDQLIINDIDYTPFVKFEYLDVPNNAREREDINSIRTKTNYTTITQHRAVTVNDYAYILESKFQPYVFKANSWDINTIETKNILDLGRVFISVIPNNYRQAKYLSTYDENVVLKEMTVKYMVGGIRLNIIKPLYLKINHYITLFYDANKLDSTIDSIKGSITKNVAALYDDSIIQFDGTLPVSRIQALIDSSDRAIIASKMNPTITIENNIEQGNEFTWCVNLGFAIVPKSITGNMFNIDGDGEGNISSKFGFIGSVDYKKGIIIIAIQSQYITFDGLFELTFTPVDPFIKTTNEKVLIDNSYIFLDPVLV